GHPQVHGEREPFIEAQEQVLAAPLDGLDRAALERALHLVRRHRSGPSRIADLDGLDRPPGDRPVELAPDRLDLGQLGHALVVLDASRRPKGRGGCYPGRTANTGVSGSPGSVSKPYLASQAATNRASIAGSSTRSAVPSTTFVSPSSPSWTTDAGKTGGSPAAMLSVSAAKTTAWSIQSPQTAVVWDRPFGPGAHAQKR